MLCAGYCVYSSAVELVFAFKGHPVCCFCLDPSIGEFVNTRTWRSRGGGGKTFYRCTVATWATGDRVGGVGGGGRGIHTRVRVR